MKIALRLILTMFLLTGIQSLQAKDDTYTFHGLHTDKLPLVWDEGIPLGNGIMGTLIWQKGENLRLALDRADLWDLRPVKEFSGPDYSYRFIQEAVKKDDLSEVYKLIDARTSQDIAPTKIPAGAIEFGIQKLGEIKSALQEQPIRWGISNLLIFLTLYLFFFNVHNSNWKRELKNLIIPYPV